MDDKLKEFFSRVGTGHAGTPQPDDDVSIDDMRSYLRQSVREMLNTASYSPDQVRDLQAVMNKIQDAPASIIRQFYRDLKRTTPGVPLSTYYQGNPA